MDKTSPEPEIKHFIEHIIDKDLESGKRKKIITRFPPEPNGFLHIGHAKAICINYGLAEKYSGQYHLRFDDTNPVKEDEMYAKAIMEDIKWLGFDWGEHLFYTSDYFETLYGFAVSLIKKGKAYVCDLSGDEIRKLRGTLTEPGKNSPYRDRTPEENLALFEKMKAGEFPNGTHVLRAKIDMSHGNINLRDPVMYRILHVPHPRAGNAWCIYPMYDFSHGQSDSIEGITHSLCSLEFEAHRPLYDWFIENLELENHPQQIEFSRLNLNYTVMSKRLLVQLVDEGHVSGWDDPRMPTVRGMRRRGYPAAAIRELCDKIGVTKKNSIIDVGALEDCVRNELNTNAPRAMAVLDPIKVVIENYDEGEVLLDAPNHPQREELGTRKVSFGKEIYIERNDYMENASRKFFRLTEGREVRLRYSYVVKCIRAIKNERGEVTELRCTYDPETLGNNPTDGRKVKGIIHWVSAKVHEKAQVNVYDRLFSHENPLATKEDGVSFLDHLNPESLTTLQGAVVESSLKTSQSGDAFQFERLGYFAADNDSTSGSLVFNRAVTLRDTWAKIKS